jgi:REP element-mobilizing transposase RayT
VIQTVTFRLADSLPAHVVRALLDDRHGSLRYDAHLNAGRGACHLRRPEIAECLEQVLLHFDGAKYRLLAWCIMPNHVHVVVEIQPGHRLGDIVRSWKTFSARAANTIIGQSGRFWHHDYFDRYVRDDTHLEAAIAYAEGNPVDAGLVAALKLEIAAVDTAIRATAEAKVRSMLSQADALFDKGDYKQAGIIYKYVAEQKDPAISTNLLAALTGTGKVQAKDELEKAAGSWSQQWNSVRSGLRTLLLWVVCIGGPVVVRNRLPLSKERHGVPAARSHRGRVGGQAVQIATGGIHEHHLRQPFQHRCPVARRVIDHTAQKLDEPIVQHQRANAFRGGTAIHHAG